MKILRESWKFEILKNFWKVFKNFCQNVLKIFDLKNSQALVEELTTPGTFEYPKITEFPPNLCNPMQIPLIPLILH